MNNPPHDIRFAYNRLGWFAIRHKIEGFWLGHVEGVPCFETQEEAAAVMAAWDEMNGNKHNLEIAPFTGAIGDCGVYIEPRN